MAPRRPSRPPIGASLAPDLDSDHLESVELETLAPRFALEDARVASASLAEADAVSVHLKRVRLEDVDLTGSKLRSVELVDLAAERIDAANGDWGGAQIRRALFGEARLTGLSLAEARIEEVRFRSCKLDYANFRHSEIARVSFEDCVLDHADFQGARIEATLFSGCRLVGTDFSRAALARVDLRGSELAPVGPASSLRGAIIDPLQLIELARPLAQEVGITVEDR
jgi:uncharacterized protein YjbI with pentapeptide repeats